MPVQSLAVCNIALRNIQSIPGLTALTSLDLRFPLVQKAGEACARFKHSSETVAAALRGCSMILSLTIGSTLNVYRTYSSLHQNDVCVKLHREELSNLPTMACVVVEALESLTRLTYLKFEWERDVEISTQQLAAVFLCMPQLRHLSIRSDTVWQNYITAVTSLTQLESFVLISSGSFLGDGQKLVQSMPESLTSLDLQCTLTTAQQLSYLTSLQFVRFSCYTNELPMEQQLSMQLACLSHLPCLRSASAIIPSDVITTCCDGNWCHWHHVQATVEGMQRLPVCITELCLTRHTVPVEAVAALARLTALQHLDIGFATSDEQLLCLAKHVPSLCELRKLTVRLEHSVTYVPKPNCSPSTIYHEGVPVNNVPVQMLERPICSAHACGELLLALGALPRFEGVDAGSDSQFLKGMGEAV